MLINSHLSCDRTETSLHQQKCLIRFVYNICVEVYMGIIYITVFELFGLHVSRKNKHFSKLKEFKQHHCLIFIKRDQGRQEQHFMNTNQLKVKIVQIWQKSAENWRLWYSKQLWWWEISEPGTKLRQRRRQNTKMFTKPNTDTRKPTL